MINKVRIKKRPLSITKGNQVVPAYSPYELSQPSGDEVKQTLQPVPRSEATLEAEKGETAYVPDVQGLGAHYKIGGKRHSAGGTPLKLNDDAFIFSDTASMKIKGPILETFGKNPKAKKKSYTPAELAMQYDINKYRKILADPQSDEIMVRTAEMMIASYNKKLGALALVQEAQKGFPDGIPKIALPFLASTGIEPSTVLPLRSPDEVEQPEDMDNEQMEQEPAMARYGGFFKAKLPKHQGPPGEIDNEDIPEELFARPGMPSLPSGPRRSPLSFNAGMTFPLMGDKGSSITVDGSYNNAPGQGLNLSTGYNRNGFNLGFKYNMLNDPMTTNPGSIIQPLKKGVPTITGGYTGKIGSANVRAGLTYSPRAFGGVAGLPDDWHHYAYGGAYGGNAFQNGPMGFGQEGGYPEDMPQQAAPDEGQGDQMQQIMEGVAQAIQQGTDPKQVLQALVKMGIPMKDAVEIIQQVIQGGQQGQEQEQQMQTARYGGYHYLPKHQTPPGQVKSNPFNEPQRINTDSLMKAIAQNDINREIIKKGKVLTAEQSHAAKQVDYYKKLMLDAINEYNSSGEYIKIQPSDIENKMNPRGIIPRSKYAELIPIYTKAYNDQQARYDKLMATPEMQLFKQQNTPVDTAAIKAQAIKEYEAKRTQADTSKVTSPFANLSDAELKAKLDSLNQVISGK